MIEHWVFLQGSHGTVRLDRKAGKYVQPFILAIIADVRTEKILAWTIFRRERRKSEIPELLKMAKCHAATIDRGSIQPSFSLLVSQDILSKSKELQDSADSLGIVLPFVSKDDIFYSFERIYDDFIIDMSNEIRTQTTERIYAKFIIDVSNDIHDGFSIDVLNDMDTQTPTVTKVQRLDRGVTPHHPPNELDEYRSLFDVAVRSWNFGRRARTDWEVWTERDSTRFIGNGHGRNVGWYGSAVYTQTYLPIITSTNMNMQKERLVLDCVWSDLDIKHQSTGMCLFSLYKLTIKHALDGTILASAVYSENPTPTQLRLLLNQARAVHEHMDMDEVSTELPNVVWKPIWSQFVREAVFSQKTSIFRHYGPRV